VPTFAEQGYPAMTEVPWLAFWTKPSVPAAVQERLRSETLKALTKPAVRERFATLGFEPGSAITSDEMAKELRASYDKQAATLKAINFKPE
jgi:tripartite-type tricarboxylate transporter receptor subunit TctC